MERLARIGYASKAIVYCLIGILALVAAFGRSEASDSRGAFLTILRQPFGTFLLALVAIGLLGYALWRVVEAINNPERKGIPYRVWLAGRGLFHGYLAWEAIRLAFGDSAGGNDARHWTRRLMDQPFGVWLVALTGMGIAAYGIGQIVRATRANVDRRLRLGELSVEQRRWVIHVSRYGLSARGVVFVIIGWFLILAARQEDPSEARDLGGALRTIEQSSYGRWLLAVVAAGLLAYGLYEATKARYRLIAA